MAQDLSLELGPGESGSGPSATVRSIADQNPDLIRISGDVARVLIPPAELCTRLRRAAERAARKDADSMDKLREAVCEYTAVLRDSGLTPEAALISLKAVINIHCLPPNAPDPNDTSGYQLREKISSWSIEEYFKVNTG